MSLILLLVTGGPRSVCVKARIETFVREFMNFYTF